MTTENGLIRAFLLDGRGSGRMLDWSGIKCWKPEHGVLWMHLDYANPNVHSWLSSESGIDPITVQVLKDQETRPRSLFTDQGVLINLRGVNNNPGSDPEDMVSIRLHCTEHRVISLRHRPLLTAADIAKDLEQDKGPCTAGELVALLASRMVERMNSVIIDLDDRADELEERIIGGAGQELRSKLLDLRREIISLRRYLSPQREALNALYKESNHWVNKEHQSLFREAVESLARYLEDLDSAKDRASVAYEELSNRLADQMNTRMYVLSIVAGVFLPLGFLTGLLGVNVGGIPLAENPWGFMGVTLFLILVVVLQIWYFRWKRWI